VNAKIEHEIERDRKIRDKQFREAKRDFVRSSRGLYGRPYAAETNMYSRGDEQPMYSAGELPFGQGGSGDGVRTFRSGRQYPGLRGGGYLSNTSSGRWTDVWDAESSSEDAENDHLDSVSDSDLEFCAEKAGKGMMGEDRKL
jgi:hypothetical protein